MAQLRVAVCVDDGGRPCGGVHQNADLRVHAARQRVARPGVGRLHRVQATQRRVSCGGEDATREEHEPRCRQFVAMGGELGSHHQPDVWRVDAVGQL